MYCEDRRSSDIPPDGYQNSLCYIEFMKSHERSHDLGTLGRKVLWNYLLYSYVNAHNLLGPLLTVDWTTSVESTPPWTRKQHISSPLACLELSIKPYNKYKELGKKGKEIRKVTRDFATSVSLTSLWIKSTKRNSSFATLPMHRIIIYLHLGASCCFA